MKKVQITLSAFLLLLYSCSILSAQPVAFTRRVHPLEYIETVEVSPGTQGMWEQLDEQTLLWQLPIASPGATSLSLGFTDFSMPPGGRLYIYSADQSQVIGPYTESDNKEHGQLWTPIIKSEAVVIELIIPASEVQELKLELVYINHGYRDLNPQFTNRALGDSAPCHVNAACQEGEQWRNQIRSVAIFQVTNSEGSFVCTGSLVNNTLQDDKPYFLTAFHCFDEWQDKVLVNPAETTASMIIYWNYESSDCQGRILKNIQSQSGASFRAGYWKSDFALVELDNNPPRSADVYYTGWDRNSNAPSSAVSIHHPDADIKKISIENDPLTKSTLIEVNSDTLERTDFGPYFFVNDWDAGITAGGSSGGPLFNSNKRIVGLLRGGQSFCGTPGPDWFGPFYRSWAEGGTRSTNLKDWLDPFNSGVTSLNGKNPVAPICQIVTIGNGTTDWEFPMHTWYHDSRTQAIYRNYEIGRSGTISGLALYVSRIPGLPLKNWTIRMRHTDKDNALENYMYVTGWTTVYQKNETINSTGWIWFEFQQPFEYSGPNNLMVDFSHNNDSYSSSGMCRSTNTGTIRTLIAYSDSTNGDPLNWSGYFAPNRSSTDRVPNIKLEFCE
jgi:hypothetical protein